MPRTPERPTDDTDYDHESTAGARSWARPRYPPAPDQCAGSGRERAPEGPARSYGLATVHLQWLHLHQPSGAVGRLEQPHRKTELSRRESGRARAAFSDPGDSATQATQQEGEPECGDQRASGAQDQRGSECNSAIGVQKTRKAGH